MIFLPGGRLLVTERAGALKLFSPANRTTIDVTGMPKVAYGGQGGLGDVVLGPDADTTDSVYPIYLSWAEAGERSEEHTSELQSLMRISYAVFCLKKQINT